MKYQGVIGFARQVEYDPINHPSVFKEMIIERKVVGDVLRRSSRYQNGQYIHDDLAVTNTISIVADPNILENAYQIKYLTYLGAKWKVTEISVEPPRLILSLGELYHGN